MCVNSAKLRGRGRSPSGASSYGETESLSPAGVEDTENAEGTDADASSVEGRVRSRSTLSGGEEPNYKRKNKLYESWATVMYCTIGA